MMLSDRLLYCLGVNSDLIGFAGAVDVGDHDMVCIFEGLLNSAKNV